MANHQYYQVMDIDELKRACPNINFDNCQLVMGDSPVIQLGSQEQLVINDGGIIYQQPQHSQIAQQQYIIQEEDIQSDGSFASHAGQVCVHRHPVSIFNSKFKFFNPNYWKVT